MRPAPTTLRKLLVEFEGSRPPTQATVGLGLTLAPAHVAAAMREAVGLPRVLGLLVRDAGYEPNQPTAALRRVNGRVNEIRG